jgi:hypothetical protein
LTKEEISVVVFRRHSNGLERWAARSDYRNRALIRPIAATLAGDVLLVVAVYSGVKALRDEKAGLSQREGVQHGLGTWYIRG